MSYDQNMVRARASVTALGPTLSSCKSKQYVTHRLKLVGFWRTLSLRCLSRSVPRLIRGLQYSCFVLSFKNHVITMTHGRKKSLVCFCIRPTGFLSNVSPTYFRYRDEDILETVFWNDASVIYFIHQICNDL